MKFEKGVKEMSFRFFPDTRFGHKLDKIEIMLKKIKVFTLFFEKYKKTEKAVKIVRIVTNEVNFYLGQENGLC